MVTSRRSALGTKVRGNTALSPDVAAGIERARIQACPCSRIGRLLRVVLLGATVLHIGESKLWELQTDMNKTYRCGLVGRKWSSSCKD